MKNKILLVILPLVFFICLPRTLYAKTVIFQDNFDDNDISDWVLEYNTCKYNGVPSQWEPVDGKLWLKINGGGCFTVITPSNLDIPDNRSYSLEMDMGFPTSTVMDRNFLFKFLNLSNWYGTHFINNKFLNPKVVNGVNLYPGANELIANYNFIANQQYHFETIVSNESIIFKINGNQIGSRTESEPILQNKTFALYASAGGNPISEVWFDNTKVTLLSEDPIGPFELPFEYEGRKEGDSEKFKTAFWGGTRSLFDHNPAKNIMVNFMGNSYESKDCDDKIEACYDSHTGVDFGKSYTGDKALSVGEGYVSYRSDDKDKKDKEKEKVKCVEEKHFGCVVIASYASDEYPGLYSLYAHLDSIEATEGAQITDETILGEIGSTGKSTAAHLHFSTLKVTPEFGIKSFKQMTKQDWKGLINNIADVQAFSVITSTKSVCIYKAPNDIKFAMIDPNGWSGDEVDPWSLATEDGGCGIESPYLWKYKTTLSSD